MSIQLNPYMYFDGSAREAMVRYATIFGGELSMLTFGEAGMPASAGPADSIMHAQLTAADGLTLMASDIQAGQELPRTGAISIIISGRDEPQLTSCWEQLSADGNVTSPFARAPWNDIFGSCSDKFGVSWIVNVVSDGRPIPVP